MFKQFGSQFEGYEVIKLLYVVDNQLNKLYNLIILKRKRGILEIALNAFELTN